MHDSDGMPSELSTAYLGSKGMIVSLLIWVPLAMTTVFLTQSGYVMWAAYTLLVLLFVLRSVAPMRRHLQAVLTGRFNGEAWLSHIRKAVAVVAVVFLIFPISLALSLELSKHAVLAFKDGLYSDSFELSAEAFVIRMSDNFPLASTFLFVLSCFGVKPEGGTATPRQLLFLVYLFAALFIFLSGEGWVIERMYLLSLKISGNEFSDLVSATLNVALLSIVALIACYCYYKISIALFEYLVAKDKKLQFRKSMFKGLLGKKENQEIPKLLGVIGSIERGGLFVERGGLLSVIMANSACLLAIIIYLVM